MYDELRTTDDDEALDPRAKRKARRDRFWSDLADILLSIPAGVGIRIGG